MADGTELDTTQNDTQPIGKSLDDIAEMMATKRAERAAELEAATQLPKDDDDTSDRSDGSSDHSDGHNDDTQLGDDDESEKGQAVEDDTSSEDDQFGAVELDITDEDLFEVDGVDDPVSLGDLKSRFTADDTITKRMSETAAANKEASTARLAAQTDAAMIQQAMTALVAQMDGMIAEPLVEPPNEALKTSNPALYIQHTELYQQDQKRIADSRETVQEALAEFGTKQKELQDNRRAHEMSLLVNVIPEMRSADKRDAVATDILSAAKHYGFTQDEVTGNVVDHRLFHMAHDAAKYHKLMADQPDEGERVSKVRKTLNTSPRVLRSRGTSAKSVLSSAKKRVIATRKQAQATGKTEDVTEFIRQKRNAQ